MSKEADYFFNKFQEGLVGGINTIAIGIVEKFDGAKMKADVKVLPDNALVVDVPVATFQTSQFYIRVPYKKGDHVIVAFAQRDIDGIMYGGDEIPSQRMLSLDDAIVIGGINLFANPLPGVNADDLIIAKKDLNSKIVLDATGNITVESAGNVFLGGGDASEGVPLGDTLKQWLDGHTHGTTPGPPPTDSSPSPSKGVKVK